MVAKSSLAGIAACAESAGVLSEIVPLFLVPKRGLGTRKKSWIDAVDTCCETKHEVHSFIEDFEDFEEASLVPFFQVIAMNDFASKKSLRQGVWNLAKTLFLAKTLRSANDASDEDFEILNNFFNDPQEGVVSHQDCRFLQGKFALAAVFFESKTAHVAVAEC